MMFSIGNHHKCLGQVFPLHLNTYVMGLRPSEIFRPTLSVRGSTLYVRVVRF